MNVRSSRQLPLLLVFILTGAIILFWYSPILFSPNDYVFHPSGDGLKNYYSPWYHVKHDSTYLWFEGMNYPYGDNLTFADGQPLVANTLKFVSRHVVDLSDHTIGILNLMMLLVPLLTAFLVFGIFRRLGVTGWYAAIAASLIALLSPQLLRTYGHYGLAYSFWIPLFWYLAIRSWEQKSIVWDIALPLALFLSAWLHPYYLMIGAIFLAFTWFFKWLIHPPQKRFLLRQTIQCLSQTALPVILFKLCLGWMEGGITDRPSSPYGFEEFYATWRTVFLPYPMPGMEWVKQFQTAQEVSWEGVAYVGFLGSLTALGWLLGMGRRALRKRSDGLKKEGWIRKIRRILAPVRNPILAASILGGIAILIFACGFPFSIKPDRMTELFPPIKQFRSLGRFTWAFYYVWCVFGFYGIYVLRRAFIQKGRKIASLVILIPILVFATEAFFYQLPVRRKIMEATERRALAKAAEEPILSIFDKVNTAEYDALLILPYLHIGSENLFASDSLTLQILFPAAMKTGLPLLNGMMSRTSISQSWKMMQWLGRATGTSEILAELPAHARILVFSSGRQNPFDGCDLLAGRQPLVQQGPYQLFDIHRDALQDPIPLSCLTMPDTTGWIPAPQISNSHINQPDPDLWVQTFDSVPDIEGYKGMGAARLRRADNNYFYQRPIQAAKGDTLVVSCWARIRADQLPLTMMGMEQKNAQQENELWAYHSFTDLIKGMDREWAFLEREYAVPNTGLTGVVNITRWSAIPPTVDIDGLMVRNKKTQIIEMRQGWVWLNNFPLKPIGN